MNLNGSANNLFCYLIESLFLFQLCVLSDLGGEKSYLQGDIAVLFRWVRVPLVL
jgi:hypothetical protein